MKTDYITGNKNKIKKTIIDLLKNHVNLFILIAIAVLLLVALPSFSNPVNLINILKQVTINGIIAVGMTFVVIGGGLDLSVGSMFSLSGVLAVSLLSKNTLLAIAIPLLAVLFFGFINGYISSKFELSSIIVTLGTLFIISGTALVYTKGALQRVPDGSAYKSISEWSLFNIPGYIIIFIVLIIILSILLHATKFGRAIYLIGTNLEAARTAGIKVNIIRVLCFIISGFCVAIGAFILSSRLASASPTTGNGYEFEAITAILIGGNSIFGGKGGIYNTIVGVLLLGIVSNAMRLINLPFAFQSMLTGILVIIAVYFDVKTRAKL